MSEYEKHPGGGMAMLLLMIVCFIAFFPLGYLMRMLVAG